ncbi:transcription elongation factor GreAB [Myxococcus xanthus]|uniref:nucleoside diphosphate kinase regulator n=1 Tax=Myxococcus xanthus TaxID=34 RepID=UPI00112A54ED|nr:nucleoside diphosphate kinase regulator [Myxococcus xanthus]QDE90773.1 transcription elongation factor GreAB [Myxococcus xanthus]QQR41427.1 nucleoside diphosphate kinase regulator [Myxococcus xanthus]
MRSEQTLIVTEADLERLRQVVDHNGGGRTAEFAEMLDAELTRARVVASEAVPPDVVTMNSKVVFEDEQTGERREVTLVYPRDASSDDGRISVLAPIGSALIGLTVGQTITWPLPGGRSKRLRIVAVPYQPEASGHYNL